MLLLNFLIQFTISNCKSSSYASDDKEDKLQFTFLVCNYSNLPACVSVIELSANLVSVELDT